MSGDLFQQLQVRLEHLRRQWRRDRLEQRNGTIWERVPTERRYLFVLGHRQCSRLLAASGLFADRQQLCDDRHQRRLHRDQPDLDPAGRVFLLPGPVALQRRRSRRRSHVQILQYVASATWSNACQTLAGNSACSPSSSAVTQGPATRVISGLAVTEPAWAEHNTYTCGVTTPVDTCSGNVTGCSQTAATCAQTGAGGTCALWSYTYACPNNDGSGGCEQNNYTYQCTADVAAADPAVSTSPYLVSANWTTECLALSQNGACSLSNDQTDGASTRMIGGLSVTEPGWNKTDTYTCWTSKPIDGCSGNITGCN